MTARLTDKIRFQLLNDILLHRFAKPIAEQLTQEIAFAHDVFDRAYEEYLDLIDNAPAGFFETFPGFQVRINGEPIGLSFNRGFYLVDDHNLFLTVAEKNLSGPYPKSRRMPHTATRWNSIAYFNGSSGEAKQFQEISAARSKLIEQINEISAKTKGILYNAGSLKTLISQWPEIESFASPYLGKKSPFNLPVAQIADLNAALDLPPETATA